MRQEFTVLGKLPGANECLWKHWRTFDRLKKHAQVVVGLSIRQAGLRPVQSACVEFEWREADQKRDFDNVIFAQKFVLDALVAKGILPDDGWAYITGIAHQVVLDPEHPGVRVTLYAGKEDDMATKKKPAVKAKAKKKPVRRKPPIMGTAEPISS